MRIYNPKNEKGQDLATVQSVSDLSTTVSTLSTTVAGVKTTAEGAIQSGATVTANNGIGLTLGVNAVTVAVTPATLSGNAFSTSETKVAKAGDVQKAINAAVQTAGKQGVETSLSADASGVITVSATGLTSIQVLSIIDNNGEFWQGEVVSGSNGKKIKVWATAPTGTFTFSVAYLGL